MLRSSTTSPSSLADIPGSLHRSGSKCSCTRLSASPSRHEEVASLATLQQVAETRGLYLRARPVWGLGYEVVCRDGDEEGPLVGISGGIVLAPLRLQHCDKMTISTRRLKGERGDRIKRGWVGLGVLVALTVFAYGYENGCQTAEILAINDEDDQHRKLVAYYRRMFGFKVVRELTGKLRDFPDMVVWGGVGTRMDGNLRSILQKWTAALHKELRTYENESAS